jgi:hypothetical protein
VLSARLAVCGILQIPYQHFEIFKAEFKFRCKRCVRQRLYINNTVALATMVLVSTAPTIAVLSCEPTSPQAVAGGCLKYLSESILSLGLHEYR